MWDILDGIVLLILYKLLIIYKLEIGIFIFVTAKKDILSRMYICIGKYYASL